jgi:hypothetical protein
MYAMNDETTHVDASVPELLLDQHVKYIQALDTVCHALSTPTRHCKQDASACRMLTRVVV